LTEFVPLRTLNSLPPFFAAFAGSKIPRRRPREGVNLDVNLDGEKGEVAFCACVHIRGLAKDKRFAL